MRRDFGAQGAVTLYHRDSGERECVKVSELLGKLLLLVGCSDSTLRRLLLGDRVYDFICSVIMVSKSAMPVCKPSSL